MKMIEFTRPMGSMVVAMAMLTVGCSGGDKSETEPEEPGATPDEVLATLVRVEVLDYSPAPGQFVNEAPEYEEGDSQEIMNKKATECLNDGDMISLGAWGGSVTLKLVAPIENKANAKDFRIKGNAVYATSSTEGLRYGSAEPGIVMVMSDTNGNGKADDIWCELKGDQTFNGRAEYEVTYYRPAADATDDQYISWRSTTGDEGYINRNSGFHTQDFFPMWIANTTELKFNGRRLPDNGHYNNATGKYDLMSYSGYADSHPNTVSESGLDIDDAIDENGKKVALKSIDFIKIYTGVLQANGPLGECSTEVAGVEKFK